MDKDKHHHEECCCSCGCEQSHKEVSCSCSEDHTCKEEVCSCGHENSCSEDSCGCGCGCGEEHEGGTWELALGGVLFLVTELLGVVPEAYELYVLVLAYLLLGLRIVWKSLQNIFKGNLFDENFLMTIATLGAFAIKAWEEAVGVMFFYRLGEYFEHRATEKSRQQIMAVVDMRPEVVNLVIDGGVNTSAMLKVKVQKVLAESMVTKILNSVEHAAANKPVIEKFITRFARIYTPCVVAIALVVAVVPSLITGAWQKWIYTALTFLVISCPCALVLSVPLSYFSGIGAGSRQGILFKSGLAMEALKKVKAVVMDKTGTVTKGNFVLQNITGIEGVSANELLKLCAGAELASTHPIGVSIIEDAKVRGLNLQRPDKFEEFAGEGIVAHYGNDVLVCGNEKLMNRYGVELSVRNKVESGSEVLVARNSKYLGQLVISDSLKEDAKLAIASLKNQGLVTVMLTGDNDDEALAIAKEAGITEVRAKLLPQEKLNELVALRKKYGSVIYVGDGINDAPSLAMADVSIAMGTGADAAIEAADVVIMNAEMKSIPKAIAIARETGKIAWQNVVVALGVKGAIIIAGIFGYASMWAAVFADTGVALLCVMNSIRILYKKF